MVRAFYQTYSFVVGVLLLVLIYMSGCATSHRVLAVKSEPADAEICLKGKYGSRYFPANKKHCVGATPFEADKIELVDEKGETKEVSFSDLEGDKENFYVLISKQGYATQSMQVPAWDHFVALRPDATSPGAGGSNVTVIQAPVSPPVAAAPSPAPTGLDPNKASIKITSNPVGALVYINDVLKGNTPYIFEGSPGTSARIKLEQVGYQTTEKSVALDGGKLLDLNISLQKEENQNIAHQNTQKTSTVGNANGHTNPTAGAASTGNNAVANSVGRTQGAQASQTGRSIASEPQQSEPTSEENH